MILAKIHLTEKERPDWNKEDNWVCFVRFYGNYDEAKRMAEKLQRHVAENGMNKPCQLEGEVRGNSLFVGIVWDFLLQNGFKPHPRREELCFRETLLDKIKKII